MHHRGHADCAHGVELRAESGPDIGLESGKAALHAGADHVHRIGPDAVHELIFPLKIAGGDGDVFLVDQHGLDAGRAELDPQSGFRKVHVYSPVS